MGIAQYRVGQYKEALETLTQSDQLNTVRFNSSIPGDLAFLAMAQHRLGHQEPAQAALQRLREAMKTPRWANNTEAQAFLREAEACLREPPGPDAVWQHLAASWEWRLLTGWPRP
jgi:hypothetical protein